MLSRLRSKPAEPVSAHAEAERVASLRSELAEDPLLLAHGELRAWADDACAARYLRARAHDEARAAALLRATLRWRAGERVHEYLPAKASPRRDVLLAEAASGKMFVLPRPASLGRPVIVMRPGLENSADPQKNLQYLVYTLERAAAMCPPDSDGKFVVIIDYQAGDFSLRRAPSMSTSKATLAILQDHYPERLGLALLFDAPAFFQPIFRMLKPFIDSRTAAKIHFLPSSAAGKDSICMEALIPEHTPKEYGGSLAYSFDSDVYFETT